jgi:nitroreductase/NAD-dependent dihydropyrimidine dehydrogenase PreA subunit
MSWVSIDHDRCNNCELCALRCPLVFRMRDERMQARADADNCNLCGHCISLCPTDAIVHTELDMGNFARVDESVDFDPDRFMHFIRRRRSVRHFKNRRVPREALLRLIEVCRYCPTGGNRQPVHLKVIEDPDRIESLSHHTVDFFLALIARTEAEIAALRDGGRPVPEELQTLCDSLARYKLVGAAREVGRDVILHQAPAVMVFHGPRNASTAKDDCVIAAQSVVMAAMTLGLGTCYIGLFTAAASAHPPLQELLALAPGHKVYSTLVLGYPRLRFLRTVDRKPIRVSWE